MQSLRAKQRRQDHRQRLRLIDFLFGRCGRCGLSDHRGLVIIREAGYLALHDLYTLMLNEPEIASAELRLLCATCRQIERYQDPSVAPSMSSPDVQPPTSEDQPSSGSDRGAALEGWGCVDADGVAFG
jgi:hypothetical protein